MRSLDIASTGMLAQQTNVDVIANNIANISTTGYKRQRAEFEDLLYQNITRVGTSSSSQDTTIPTGVQLGLGVKNSAIYRIHEQGSFTITDNSFDLAISGKGFFQVDLPDGTTAYTRAGSFQTNQTGEIVTSQGFTVAPGLTIPTNTTSVDINKDGQVLVTVAGQTTKQNVGQITLVNFQNEAGLEAKGGNLFVETEASGTPIQGVAGDLGFGSIEQGALEISNVDPVKEITSLITAQRAYETNSKMVQASDQMLQAINSLK